MNSRLKLRYLASILLLITSFFPASLTAQETGTKFNLEQFDIYYWQAEKDGRVSYLLGTLHLLSGECLLPIEDKIKNADTVILEARMFPGVEEKIIQLALLEPDEDLSEILPPDLYAKAKSFYEKRQLPWEVWRNFKPWYLALNAEILYFAEIYGLPKIPMDIYIAQVAQNSFRPIAGLETVEEQLGVLDGFSDAIQIEHLKQSLSADAREEIVKLIDYYLNKDFKGIEDLAKETNGNAYLEMFYEKMIIERNQRMNTKVLPYLEQDSCFIAVGLLHLLGENGMIDFLKSKGYDIKLKSFSTRFSTEAIIR